MPYGYVLDARLFLPNFRHRVLETIRKSLPLSLKLYPTMLKLAMAVVVDGLPIIINDKVSDVNIILC